MKWKYIYDVLRQRSALSRYCGIKGHLVADECDRAINVLKKASRQKSKESQISSHNKAMHKIAPRLEVIRADIICGDDEMVRDAMIRLNAIIAQLRHS